MEYKRFGNTIAMRLDKGDEVVEQIMALAKRENIRLASVTGIGATDDLTIGVFDTAQSTYRNYTFTGTHEITGLTGSINTMGGEAYSHLHITCAGDGGSVVGGHLFRCMICLTAEIVVQIIDGAVDRKRNEVLGINTWDFDCE